MSNGPSRPKKSVGSSLKQYAKSNDPVGIINRGHQFLQHALRKVVSAYAPRQGGITRMKYDRLMQLANTLGVVTAYEFEFLQLIDKLRNGIDHDLHEPDADDERDVWIALDRVHSNRQDTNIGYGSKAFPFLLALAIFSMWRVLMRKSVILSSRPLPDLSSELYELSREEFQVLPAAIIMGTMRQGGEGAEMIANLLDTQGFNGQ